MSRRWTSVSVAAVLLVVLGALAPWAYATWGNTSAKDRIEADPPPALFDDRAVAPTAAAVAGQQARAHALLRGWWSAHGDSADDAAFVRWLEQTLPGPPDASTRSAELDQVERLAPTRTKAGVAAATWLEAFGKKDVWKLAAHDQGELLPAQARDRVSTDVKDLLGMAKTVADALGARYQQSAPYVLHPELRPDHTVAPGQVCPCSYPSRHASASAAARTYLSLTDPHRAAEYTWMESEVDYSRIYMAGHVVSDITAGALLGDLIGEYVAHTHGHLVPLG